MDAGRPLPTPAPSSRRRRSARAVMEAGFAAHLLGQDGAVRGLRAGPGWLAHAHGRYAQAAALTEPVVPSRVRAG